MNLPSGLIFYLDFKYGTDQTSLHTENSDVYGNTSGSNVDASGGLYGAGKFGYSINDKATGNLTIGTAANGSNFTTGSADWQMLILNQTLSAQCRYCSNASGGIH